MPPKRREKPTKTTFTNDTFSEASRYFFWSTCVEFLKNEQVGTSMEDSTNSTTSILNCASSTSDQNVVFLCEYLWYYSSEINDGTFFLAPEIYSP